MTVRRPSAQGRDAGKRSRAPGRPGEIADRGVLANWPRVRIAATCESTTVEDPRSRPSFRYLDISSIDRLTKTISEAPEIDGLAAPSRARKVIRGGDVLVSTVRPNLNAVAIVPEHLDGEIASTGFSVLRPKCDRLAGRYLYYYCCTPAFVADLTATVRGAQYPAVSDEDVKDVAIPLAPLSEQRRIVEILDQADRLRRLRAAADAKADRILPALFIKMFGDPATNPMGWMIKPLGELSEHVTSGSRAWARFTGRGYAYFLRTQDIVEGEIAESLLALDPPRGAEAERTRLQDGDVAVTITGIVGKAAAFRARERDVYVSQHVALVRPDPGRLNSDFLTSYVNLPVGKVPVLARFQYGQTKPGLGFRELTHARIPVPPIDMQTEFSTRLKDFRLLQGVRVGADTRIHRLWRILLARAFDGDLTGSWREAHMNELLQEMGQQAKALAEVAP